MVARYFKCGVFGWRMNKLKERKIIEKWIMNNGAAQFDTKNRNVILNDGGLFSIEKTIKIKPKTKIIVSDKPEIFKINGKEHEGFPVLFKKIKRKGKQIKEKVEYLHASLWFEEVDETVDYFKRVKRLLNRLGYRTNYRKK